MLLVLLNRHLVTVTLAVSLFQDKATQQAQCGVPVYALQVFAEQQVIGAAGVCRAACDGAKSSMPEAQHSSIAQCDVHVSVLQVLTEQHMMKLRRLQTRVPELSTLV